MQWSEVVDSYIKQITEPELTPAIKKQLTSYIDLTSLSKDDNSETILSLLSKAHGLYGHVAALCIYPKFVSLLAPRLKDTPIKIATVVNFPSGNEPLSAVAAAISKSIADGAQEIDLVFPYERYLAGEQKYCQSYIQACRESCGDDVKLKVILETGALDDLAIIADASFDALTAGADFIKTSTGKISQGASLESAATMLLVIKHLASQTQRNMGLKISGGIKTIPQAVKYLTLVEGIMGKNWLTPQTFRIGASQLVNELLLA